MKSRIIGSQLASPVLHGESAVLGTPTHDRLMLLELATDLQGWPARNLVFRNALDRAAQELAKIASETGVA